MINKIYKDRIPSLKSALKYVVLEERLPFETCATDIDFKSRDIL